MFLYGLLSTIYYLWIGEVQTSSLNLDVANINIKIKYNIVEVFLTQRPTNFFQKTHIKTNLLPMFKSRYQFNTSLNQ
jgi:hypothetical protein